MSGRRPISNELKKLKGTDQPCRMREEVKFEAITRIPPPPRYFNKYSKKLYKTTCNKLAFLGLLSDINLPIVIGYASMMGKYLEAEEELASTGRLFETFNEKTGEKKIVRQPLDRMATEYLDSARKYAVELGITPSSMSRVKPAETKKKNKLDQYI